MNVETVSNINPTYEIIIFIIDTQLYIRNGTKNDPDSNVHGANMEPTWVLSAPDGPHRKYKDYVEGRC